MFPAQLQQIPAIENFTSIDIKKVHHRVDVRVVLETQHVTEFMHRNAVNVRPIQLLRRCRAHADLPAKIGPGGDLRASYHGMIQKAGAAINDPYAATPQVRFFMEVCQQHAVPKSQRPPESIRPRFGRVDLVGALVAIVELWIAFSYPGDPWNRIMLAVLAASLAMVGPGAWSIDARLFGRKRIQTPDL